MRGRLGSGRRHASPCADQKNHRAEPRRRISGEFSNALVSSLGKTRTFTFSIPVDADGYVGRECTDLACKKFFKVKPGTGVANARQAFCPYCGRADNPGDFMTKQQIEYGLSIIGNQVMAEAAATAEEARIQYPSARELRPGNEPEDHPQA